MVSPKQLAARGVPVYRLVHEEGSFVVTFPNAFHSGFNTGASSTYTAWIDCKTPTS